MPYFVAIQTLSGPKATGSILYPLRKDARVEVMKLQHAGHEAWVEDADHEPGQSILRRRNLSL